MDNGPIRQQREHPKHEDLGILQKVFSRVLFLAMTHDLEGLSHSGIAGIGALTVVVNDLCCNHLKDVLFGEHGLGWRSGSLSIQILAMMASSAFADQYHLPTYAIRCVILAGPFAGCPIHLRPIRASRKCPSNREDHMIRRKCAGLVHWEPRVHLATPRPHPAHHILDRDSLPFLPVLVQGRP